jgi:hypothetical protein
MMIRGRIEFHIVSQKRLTVKIYTEQNAYVFFIFNFLFEIFLM